MDYYSAIKNNEPGSFVVMKLLTFEGLTNQSESGFLVSNRRVIDERLDGAEGSAPGVALENAPQDLGSLSPREVSRPLGTA